MIRSVQDAATRIALEVDGGDANGTSAIGDGVLLEIIMQIIMQLIGNCTATSESSIAAAIQSPTLWQRIRLRASVNEQARYTFGARFRTKAGLIADKTLEVASQLTQEEALAVVQDVRNPDFFLI